MDIGVVIMYVLKRGDQLSALIRNGSGTLARSAESTKSTTNAHLDL